MELPQNISSVSQASPIVNGRGKVIYSGKEFRRFSTKGVSKFYLETEKLKIQKGRFLSELDQYTQFAVIGNKLATELRKTSDKTLIGEILKIGGKLFTIIGVLEKAEQSMGRNSNPNKNIFIHLTTALRFNPREKIGSLKIKLKPGTNHSTVTEKIVQYLTRIKKAPRVEVESPEQLLRQMEKQMELYTLLLGSIAGISLIVGGVGVMNVMLVSITERKKEIGIRRALGARRRNISSQFLIESLVLSLLGGLLGVFFGITGAQLASKWGHWEFVLSHSAILIGFGVSSIVGIFFGLYPAVKASKLDPIAGLRSS
tara:strand:- start:543 stop:1484 length:942 start_codon:yes stop_codon:yes gene_type:complete